MENRVKTMDKKTHDVYRNIFDTASKVAEMYHNLPEKKSVQPGSGPVPQGQGKQQDHKEACMSVMGGLMDIGKGFAELIQSIPL